MLENSYLHKVDEGVLCPTTGKRTLVRAGEVFRCNLSVSVKPGVIGLFYFDEAADIRSDVESEPTGEVLFDIFERVKDGTYVETFGSFSVPLDQLCWSQDQIITLVEKHHFDKLHLANFFLFKSDGDFFVALINRMEGDELLIRGHNLSNGKIWKVDSVPKSFPPIYRHRFFFPRIP